MILMVDANLPPLLAETLNPIAQVHGHRVIHKRTYFGRTDIPDIEWMKELGKEKDAAFITCDSNILKRPPEVAAFRKANLNGFWLQSKSWKKNLTHDRFHILASKLLLRWPDLIMATSIGTSQAYEIPFSGKLKGLLR